jgi:hypothetical protein
MIKKVKLTFKGDPKNEKKKGSYDIEFDSWTGRPQLPKPVVEVYTRLGASSPTIQKVKEESLQTTSNANFSEDKIKKLEEKIRKLKEYIGQPGVWTDEAGEKIENYVMLDFSYTIKDFSPKPTCFITILGIVYGDDS